MQGTYTGLHLYKKNNQGLWTYSHRIDKVPLIPIKDIVRDKKGFFWLSHAYKGLYRMQLSDNLTFAKAWQEYESPRDLLSEYSIELTDWKKRVVIRSGEQFFTPTSQNKLISDPELEAAGDEPYKIRLGTAGEWFKVFRNQVVLNRPDGSSRSFDLSLV